MPWARLLGQAFISNRAVLVWHREGPWAGSPSPGWAELGAPKSPASWKSALPQFHFRSLSPRVTPLPPLRATRQSLRVPGVCHLLTDF